MKKVKVGIVGLGRLGRKHAENIAFRIPNSELTAVCSIVRNEVDETMTNWGIKYGYTDFDEMIKNKELEAVVICSSSTEHYNHIAKAMGAGLHVFCEKPLAMNLDDCRKVEKLLEGYSDKVFSLGFMRRYDASYRYAKKYIEDGHIGRPFMIRCYSLDPIKSVTGAIAFAEKSGGIFIDMAIHDIDLARWYLSTEAKSLYAVGGCYCFEEFSKYNDVDNAAAIVNFENGSIGMFYAGRTCVHGYHIETEIIGTKGSLRIGSIPEKNIVTIFNETGALKDCVGGFLERFENAYLNELQEFINCILEKRKPEVTVYDGTNATKAAYALKESLLCNDIIRL